MTQNTYNYNNLEVGQTYKSYRQLCDTLGAKVEAGNSKKAQLREWECYFLYRKQGNKFIIDEIYEIPLDKEETRGRPSVYGNMVQLLILDLLGKSRGSIVISANKLMEAIGMTNENYGKCQDNALGLSDYSNMEIGYIYDFYNSTGSGLRGVIKTALNNLDKKLIINYSKVVKVKERSKAQTRLASDEEVELLMDISKDILNELGFEDINEVRRSTKWGEYLKLKKKALYEKTVFEFDYSAYKIVVNRNHLEKEKTKLTSLILDEETFNKETSDLNGLIIENTINNAKNRVDNINKASDKLAKLRSRENYIDNIIELCRLTINKNTSPIYETVHERQLRILNEIELHKEEKIIDGLLK